MHRHFKVPTELEFIEWFGDIPEKFGELGYRYRITDELGVSLIFSFEIHTNSVQTILKFGDQTAITVVHENATEIGFQQLGNDKILYASFSGGNEETELTIENTPRIKVQWNTLSRP